MKREELVKDKNYVFSGIQLQLLNMIEDYMRKNNLNREKLAKKLNVSKGYISQLLNVSFDHKISKLVELALECNMMPVLNFVEIESFVRHDISNKTFDLLTMYKNKEIVCEDLLAKINKSKPKVYKFEDVKQFIVDDISPKTSHIELT